MSRDKWQVGYASAAIVITFCVHWLDISLAGKLAPAIANSLAVPLGAMTVVFSSSRLGLAVGAVLGGLAGDRWGRKSVLCVCLGLSALNSLFTPAVHNFTLFAATRCISGLLLGGAAPCALALIASIVSERRRAIAVTTTLAGASVGSAIDSWMVYRILNRPEDWRVGFFICGVILVGTLLLVVRWVPDVRAPTSVRTRTSVLGLLGPMRTISIVLALCFLLSMGLNALLASWLPSFFQALAGVSVQRFAGIAMLTQPAAILGMLCTGWFQQRVSAGVLILVCFSCDGLALALLGSLGFASTGFTLALAIVACSQAACQALLNLYIVAWYPTELRATALGAAAAAGRLGGIFSPAIGALALEMRPSVQSLFVTLGMIPLLVGLLLWTLRNSALYSGSYSSVVRIHR